jgi:hypothetical protein
MRNGGWICRQAHFGKGVWVQESGGARFDPAGKAGHSLCVRFSVKGEDSYETNQRAWRIVGNLRAALERGYGCQLSEPILRSTPKHSVTGDPIAAAVSATGATIHGEFGVDNTPQKGTLEFSGANAPEQVSAYVKGVQQIGTVGERLDALATKIDSLAGQVSSLTGSTEKVAGALGLLVERLTPPASRPIPPVDPWEGGYA